jgi:hypothetical protein
MARPRVADGGGGSLHMWRVAVNMFNKQSRTAEKGWSSGVGEGWARSCYILLLNVIHSLGIGRILYLLGISIGLVHLGLDGKIILEWILGK